VILRARLSARICSPSGLLGTRPAERTLPSLADRDLAEIEMHV